MKNFGITARALGLMAAAGGLWVSGAGASVLYVRAEASAGGDGQSWATAYNSLKTALTTAAGSGGAVTEIWVKEGTYLPGLAGSTDRTVSFTLLDNVGVYGGFAGTEMARDERDPAAHVTTLSGVLSASARVYNVVVGAGNAGTVLDGFSITGGVADGTAGSRSAGGGVHITGSPTIRHCVVSGNTTGWITSSSGPAYRGGGVYCAVGSAGKLVDCVITGNTTGKARYLSGAAGAGLAASGCTVQLTRCVISSNTTGDGGYSGCGGGFPTGGSPGGPGGGVYLQSASALLESCSIVNNGTGNGEASGSCARGPAVGLDGGDGAGMYVSGSTLVAVNCVFAGNRAGNGGDGSLFQGVSGTNGGAGGDGAGVYTTGGTILEFANCTLADNVLGAGGAGGGGTSPSGTAGAAGIGAAVRGEPNVRIDNCIAWNVGDSEITGSAIVTYSNVQGGYPGTGNISAAPMFVNAGIDYRLEQSSLCIDAGNSGVDIDPLAAGVQPLPATDRGGEARRVDIASVPDTGAGAPVVDMGAYENQGVACPADLNGDGLVDFSDYLEFLNLFDAGDLRVDFNGDGLVDFSDYLEFLNLFDAGC